MRNTILVGLLVLSAASCRSKKEEKPVDAPKGEVKVEVLCSGPKYFTDKDFFLCLDLFIIYTSRKINKNNFFIQIAKKD